MIHVFLCLCGVLLGLFVLAAFELGGEVEYGRKGFGISRDGCRGWGIFLLVLFAICWRLV